jgi:hypothetical protein
MAHKPRALPSRRNDTRQAGGPASCFGIGGVEPRLMLRRALSRVLPPPARPLSFRHTLPLLSSTPLPLGRKTLGPVLRIGVAPGIAARTVAYLVALGRERRVTVWAICRTVSVPARDGSRVSEYGTDVVGECKYRRHACTSVQAACHCRARVIPTVYIVTPLCTCARLRTRATYCHCAVTIMARVSTSALTCIRCESPCTSMPECYSLPER